MGVAFWGGYIMILLRCVLWLAKHPLRIGACVLLLYIGTRLMVGVMVRFVVGVFLFLTGVRGMMVAFLYVVALCPNPVFKGGATSNSGRVVEYGIVFFGPLFLVIVRVLGGYSVEIRHLSESSQWLRDPCMVGGLAELMPLLGVLLFLCMVSVVSLCGQQKQCLGGQGQIFEGGAGFGFTKRSYA